MTMEKLAEVKGERFDVERDGEPDLRFVGYLIASANGREHDSNSWEHYRLYRTATGKFVCSNEFASQWQGTEDVYSAAVCESTDEITKFFGFSKLAKELYAEAGIDTTLEVV